MSIQSTTSISRRFVAKQIKNRRRDLMIDIKVIAKRLNLSAEEYLHLESGKRDIHDRLLDTICMELRMPSADLLPQKGRQPDRVS